MGRTGGMGLRGSSGGHISMTPCAATVLKKYGDGLPLESSITINGERRTITHLNPGELRRAENRRANSSGWMTWDDRRKAGLV